MTGLVTVDVPSTATAGNYTIPVGVNYSSQANDLDTANLRVTVENAPASPTKSQSLQPIYEAVSVGQGDEETTAVPTDYDDQDIPTGTTFALGTGAPAWAEINETTGAITLDPQANTTIKGYAIPVTVTYPDRTTDTVYATASVTAPVPFAQDHEPSWGDITVTAGGDEVVSDEPTVKENDGTESDDEFPTGTTFVLNPQTGSNKVLTTAGWQLSINSTTGEITVEVPADYQAGEYNLRVGAIYSATDTTNSDTVNVPVEVVAPSVAPSASTSASASTAPSTSASASTAPSATTSASAAPSATASAPATVQPSATATSAAPSASASAPATVAPSATASAPATVAPSATASAPASASTAPQASTTAKASESAKASTSAKASETAKAEDKQVKKLPKTGVIGEAPVAAGLFGVALIGVAVTAVVRRRKG